jgi:peptidoglycan/xylan/chitin deacetylase (PgdA/CDA1 family)
MGKFFLLVILIFTQSGNVFAASGLSSQVINPNSLSSQLRRQLSGQLSQLSQQERLEALVDEAVRIETEEAELHSADQMPNDDSSTADNSYSASASGSDGSSSGASAGSSVDSAATNPADSHSEVHERVLTVKELIMQEVEKGADLCSVLETRQDEDLLIFYEELYTMASRRLSSCKTRLRNRIENYWAQKREILKNWAYDSSTLKLEPCVGGNGAIQPNQNSDQFGPSVRYEIDPTPGGTYVGNQFPKCHISITFDDGPHSILTRKLLAILAAENVQANFFVLGRKVERMGELIRSIHQAGHGIANHTWSHRGMNEVPFDDAVTDIENTFTALETLLGEPVPFFRFPYGAFTPELREYLKSTSRVELFWKMDSNDWRTKNPVKLMTNTINVVNRNKKGMLLFHDVQPQTIEMMPFFLRMLKEAGYTPVLVVPKETSGSGRIFMN